MGTRGTLVSPNEKAVETMGRWAEGGTMDDVD